MAGGTAVVTLEHAPEEARDREYMAGGRVNLLFVGKYREYKNIPVLLSALVLKEPMGPRQILGAVLILGAALICELPEKTKGDC